MYSRLHKNYSISLILNRKRGFGDFNKNPGGGQRGIDVTWDSDACWVLVLKEELPESLSTDCC